MFTSRSIAIVLALATGVALADLAQADPMAGNLPAALAATPAARTPAPATTQPEAAAPVRRPLFAGATTQPAGNGSQVSFFLTRNLPENLRVKHHLMWQQASADQRKQWQQSFTTILRETNARLEEFVAKKNQFDTLAPDVQDRYRQKAELIDQVLKGLSPSEQSQLLNLAPAERAKRIMELAAKLKIKQAREPAAPAGK